jgi:hypothetical protein
LVWCRFTVLGAVGVEWCSGTAPWGRAAVREGRNCVCFEKDGAIFGAVKAALYETKKNVMETMKDPPPFLKRKRSDNQEIVPYEEDEEGSGPQPPSQPVVTSLDFE